MEHRHTCPVCSRAEVTARTMLGSDLSSLRNEVFDLDLCVRTATNPQLSARDDQERKSISNTVCSSAPSAQRGHSTTGKDTEKGDKGQ